MSYGMVSLTDGTRKLMHHDVLRHGSPSRAVGEVIHWSSDGHVKPSVITAVIPLADVPYRRCDNGQVAYMTAWGYEIADKA